MSEKDATITALVRALEMRPSRGKKWRLPTIPIGTRVRVHDSGASGIGTVVGRDGHGFDGVLVIFDEPAPRGFENGCCAGIEQCEVLPVSDECPACSHPRDQHVGRWCRVTTGAVNAEGRKRICCCEAVEADPQTRVGITNSRQGGHNV